jgi:ligand-binding sensor domain-containing protein
LAVYDGDLYAGTAGDGVWKLTNGVLEPISEAMYVAALVGTDFGLFVATDDGLFSFKEDRWLRRRLGDSSSELSTPAALYARYPYVYVGTDRGLLTYDGGRWQEFEMAAEVSALGWHNARLYIGAVDGTLATLEGTVMESVLSPESGEITSILRFGKRLHVATDEGVFRLRHGRFEEIEWTQPAESEPKTEPIASLL